MKHKYFNNSKTHLTVASVLNHHRLLLFSLYRLTNKILYAFSWVSKTTQSVINILSYFSVKYYRKWKCRIKSSLNVRPKGIGKLLTIASCSLKDSILLIFTA